MNVRARIMVCDDDADLRDLLFDLLSRDGYQVETAEDGVALRRRVPTFRPDLVICDLMMPGEDGLSLTRWLRAEGHSAVLMLTAMGSTVDRVVGLEMGADDYLAKPFEPAELRARVKAVLRRTMSAATAAGRPATRVKVGRCVVDTELKAMFDEDGARVDLTAMEYDLLYTLITHARRPLSRDQLLELAHHKKWDPFDRSIDMRIARLRKKIEFDPAKPAVLKTVRSEGYMLVPDGE
ncbi:response regulator [Novosphingobium sp.]|uniref:response regulator n=1 Tax=Novosphingobium sp. TaxID=1874826 RepID=UPI002637DAF9|nr:response regulator [Novosphingobium sp.]